MLAETEITAGNETYQLPRTVFSRRQQLLHLLYGGLHLQQLKHNKHIFIIITAVIVIYYQSPGPSHFLLAQRVDNKLTVKIHH